MFNLFNNDKWLTQKERVLKILQSKEYVLPADFIKAYILRYWSYICQFRKEWYNIVTHRKVTKVGKSVNVDIKYSLRK